MEDSKLDIDRRVIIFYDSGYWMETDIPRSALGIHTKTIEVQSFESKELIQFKVDNKIKNGIINGRANTHMVYIVYTFFAMMLIILSLGGWDGY